MNIWTKMLQCSNARMLECSTKFSKVEQIEKKGETEWHRLLYTCLYQLKKPTDNPICIGESKTKIDVLCRTVLLLESVSSIKIISFKSLKICVISNRRDLVIEIKFKWMLKDERPSTTLNPSCNSWQTLFDFRLTTY